MEKLDFKFWAELAKEAKKDIAITQAYLSGQSRFHIILRFPTFGHWYERYDETRALLDAESLDKLEAFGDYLLKK
ncbi:MAG: hypothetical protein LBF54_02390 [Holosporaceae bacterium]|nr:hypothetical protein [Holosporaceae bacterium]